MLPTALAANSIETVAAPDEHELIEVVIVNVISQSIVLWVKVPLPVPVVV